MRSAGQRVRGLLPNETVRLGDLAVPGDRFYLAAVTVVVAMGLWAMFRFTMFCLSVCASAETERARDSLLFHPTDSSRPAGPVVGDRRGARHPHRADH